ncbi:MAG: disulfide reductase [Planctomycetota bacterium]|nr:MAG: disulfide reductase [Planctomycetota bacterium]
MEAERKYSYYPGCSLMVTNRSYDISTRNVAAVLGIEMAEIEDWNCCGATAYYPVREKRSYVLSARNLSIAERNSTDLITVCSGCYAVLKKTDKYLSEDEELREEIRAALREGGMDYEGKVKVRHFLEVLTKDLGEEAVRRHVVNSLDGMKVAPYYGCLFGRPFGGRDEFEFPEAMDDLIRWLGGEPAPFPLKSKCCGGMLMTTQPDMALNMTGKILRNAKSCGAVCIATCCPLCQINLEGYQGKVSKRMGSDCSIPVVYFTQLMGYAFGLDAEQLALKDCLTDVDSVFAQRGSKR